MSLESLIILATVLTLFPIIAANSSLVILGFSFIDLIIFLNHFDGHCPSMILFYNSSQVKCMIFL